MNIDIIKKTFLNNIVIAKNTGFLTIIELVHLLLPFIALPYVIRTIGTERYGMVAFAQTIVAYFIIIINYGLDISAVKDVAVSRDNKTLLNEIVSIVLSIKFLLFLFSFGLFMIGLWIVPFMAEHPILMIYSFIACLSELLFPVWYFQGVERMKYVTIVKCTSLLLYTISVFIFIHKESDFEKVALLQSISVLFSGIIAFYILLRVESIHLFIPSFVKIWKMLKSSFPFWLSRVSVVFNTNLAKTVSGLFLSMESVAAFDLAQRIINAVLIPTRMLNKAAYPHIARTQSRQFATKFLLFVATIAFVISSITFLTAPWLITFFAGYAMIEAITILRVLCVFVFTTSIVITMGGSILVSFGYPRTFTDSVIVSTLFLCFIYLIIYYLDIQTSFYYALALVLTDIFVLIYRMYFCRKYRLLIFGK